MEDNACPPKTTVLLIENEAAAAQGERVQAELRCRHCATSACKLLLALFWIALLIVLSLFLFTLLTLPSNFCRH